MLSFSFPPLPSQLLVFIHCFQANLLTFGFGTSPSLTWLPYNLIGMQIHSSFYPWPTGLNDSSWPAVYVKGPMWHCPHHSSCLYSLCWLRTFCFSNTDLFYVFSPSGHNVWWLGNFACACNDLHIIPTHPSRIISARSPLESPPGLIQARLSDSSLGSHGFLAHTSPGYLLHCIDKTYSLPPTGWQMSPSQGFSVLYPYHYTRIILLKYEWSGGNCIQAEVDQRFSTLAACKKHLETF